MELPLALDPSRSRRRWLLLAAAVGVSGYCAYRVYNLPAVAERRRRLARRLRALAAAADAAASSAETVSLVSGDLNRFLRGTSDEIPHTLRQLAKAAASDEFAGSVSRLAEALTVGVLRGVASGSGPGREKAGTGRPGSSFSERVVDRLISPAGSGFASAVAGSFARNTVMAFYSAQERLPPKGKPSDGGKALLEAEAAPVPAWVHLVCGDDFRRLLGDCIQQLVSTAVAVYLDKTMHINTYHEMFSGLTNPKHEAKARDMLVSVCNGAVETLVRASHQVLTSPGSGPSSWTDREEDTEVEDELPGKHSKKSSLDGGVKDSNGGWADKVSSTLAVPSNRSLVLDVTGRVTSETVRSFLDFVLRKVFDGAKKGASFVRGEAIERGLEVVRYAAAKSMVIATVWVALCLHLLSGTSSLVPA
uniref:Protein PHLOEM PROTEIN 2-LIKE A10 n=1 Tax=Anthurium amnicola TaxID=1678845 RepID=A0A1D1ZAL3_9ARAE